MKSIVEICLQSLKTNELTLIQMQKNVALNIAENLNQHHLKFYPNIPDHVQRYVNERPINGRFALEHAKDLTSWMMSIVEAHEYNLSEIELLEWAKDLCEKAQAQNAADNINTKLVEWKTKIKLYYPRDFVSSAKTVKILDTESYRNERGH